VNSFASDERVDVQRQTAGLDFDSMLAKIPKDQIKGSNFSPNGRRLWPALLLGLIAAIALESFLAGYAALKRYGHWAADELTGENDGPTSFGLEASVNARQSAQGAAASKPTTREASL
jgi:hypothetical protein